MAGLPQTRSSTRLAAKSSLPNSSQYTDFSESESSILATTSAPKRKRATSDSESDLTPVSDAAEEEQVVRKSTIRKKVKVAKSRTRVKVDIAEVAEENVEEFTETAKKPKKTRTRKIKAEPVYVIPDVESKETTFKGRLGYACLNTVLRSKRPASEAVFCSRTCRIDSIQKNGIDFVKDLGRKNAEDLLTLIEWNEVNNIRFMRISSMLFPFASHPKYGYSLTYCAPLLASIGARANELGHRLTTHPGQFTQLGSPKEDVVKASVRELEYQCEMLDLMGVGRDGVMIVHGGGVYGDKESTLARIKNTITNVLPSRVRSRLVLENDEICYNAEDLLPLCEELDVPLVFDYHHHNLYPSEQPIQTIIARTNAIFKRRGIRPKQHLSEPRPGAVTLMERRAHADRCESLPQELAGQDIDLMIEAKDKEQAVLHLYRIYNLQPVKHESLRPPSEVQTKETKGRKSAKKRNAKPTDEEVDADVILDDNEEEAAFVGYLEPNEDEQTLADSTGAMAGTSAMGSGPGSQVDAESAENGANKSTGTSLSEWKVVKSTTRTRRLVKARI